MTSIAKVHRASTAKARVIKTGELVVPNVVLKALQGALGRDRKPTLEPRGKTVRPDKASSSGAGSSSRASGAGAGASEGADAGDEKPGPLDEFGLPPDPTPAQIDRLTTGIRAAIKADSGKSDRDPSPLSPETMTPLQRLLFTAINGMSREELEGHPELLAAVREGFATEGGQQLALTINMMDAGLVGDQTGASQPLNWISLLEPKTIAHLALDLDPELSAADKTAVLDWIRNAQQSEAGRAQLAALMQGPRVRIRVDARSAGPDVTTKPGSRKIRVKAGTSPEELKQGLGSLADELSAHPGAPGSAWKRYRDAVKKLAGKGQSGGALFSHALQFDESISLETQRIIRAAVDNSPTLRNVLARSIAQFGTITVKASETSFGAEISIRDGKATISVSAGTAEDMAESTLFELCNAAQIPLLRETGLPSESHFSPAELDVMAAKMYRGAMSNSSVERKRFLDWARTQRAAEDAQERLGLSSRRLDDVLTRDLDLIIEYLHKSYTAGSVRQAAFKAYKGEWQEMDSMFMSGQIGSEVAAAEAAGAQGPAASALTQDAVARLQRWTAIVRGWAASGNVRGAVMNKQIISGHTGAWFLDVLHGRYGTFAKPASIEPAEGSASTLASDAKADAALTEAGTSAGAAAQADVRAAVHRHGPGKRGAIEEAADASVLEQSKALAARIFEHPALKRALRVGGKTLEAAAVAAMIYELGQAIYTDVKNGDHEAPATREALARLVGGLAVGVGGASAGAATGAALGSFIGPVGTAVGGFIGGLLGGIAGFEVGSRLGDQAFKLTKGPVDHLIDRLIDQHGEEAVGTAAAIGVVQSLGGGDAAADLALARRLIELGSEEGGDAWANADELRKGLEAAGYGTGHITDEQLTRLVSAYNLDGNGALSAEQIARALQDGALVLDGGLAGVNLTAALGSEQAPIDIAQRVLRHGSENDAWANRKELDKGLEAAGFGDVQASDEEMDRLIAAYGVTGSGALSAPELAEAIEDGALVLGEDGSVRVDTRMLEAQQREQAANTAARITQAAQRYSDSRDGNLPYAFFLRVGFEDAGYDTADLSGQDIEEILRLFGDGSGGIDPTGLAAAIQVGALVLGADGSVTADRAVPWPAP